MRAEYTLIVILYRYKLRRHLIHESILLMRFCAVAFVECILRQFADFPVHAILKSN